MNLVPCHRFRHQTLDCHECDLDLICAFDVQGYEIVKAIEALGSQSGEPSEVGPFGDLVARLLFKVEDFTDPSSTHVTEMLPPPADSRLLLSGPLYRIHIGTVSQSWSVPHGPFLSCHCRARALKCICHTHTSLLVPFLSCCGYQAGSFPERQISPISFLTP